MRISVHKKSTDYDGADIRMFMDVTERSGFFNLSRSGPERIFAHRKSVFLTLGYGIIYRDALLFFFSKSYFG